MEPLERRTLLAAPVAASDAYVLREDTRFATLNLYPSVLANDSNAPASAELVSDVSHGKLTFYSYGHFGYEPDWNFFGTDRFTYRATNASGRSNVATVTLTVTSRNDPPTTAMAIELLPATRVNPASPSTSI